MKKFLTLLAALLLLGSMSVVQATDYYYRGNQNGWGASLMSISTDGYYAYISALSYADNGNKNNEFKISLSTDSWDYGCSIASAGFNGTDVTNMNNSSNSWGNGDGNNAIYHTTAYYVLVYFPNTSINTSSNPVMCASTTLPDNSVTPPTPTTYTYTVAGSSTAFGSNWDKDDTNNDMTLVGELYTWEKENVTLSDNVELKVFKDHTWTGWPSSNYVISITETAVYTVTVTFNESTKEVTASAVKTGEAGPVSVTYTVAGDEVAFGTNWDPTNTDNDMSIVGELYTLTKENLTLSANVELKVCKDHAWANSWPSGDNYVLSISEAAIYSITVTFNADTKEVSASATKTADLTPEASVTFTAGTTIYYDFINYGSGINIYDGTWTPDVSSIISVELSSDLVLTANSNLFKSEASGWNFVKCSTLPELGQNMIVSTDGLNFTWDTYVAPDPVYTVAGVEVVFGSNWDPTDATNDMTLNAGVYEWSKANITLPAGNVTFKVVKDHAYANGEWPSSNYELAISEAGIYTISITFNPSNTGNEVSATALKTGDAEVENTAALTGDWDSWAIENMSLSAGKESASITKHFDAGYYEFKIVVNSSDYRSNGHWFHRDEWTGADGITSEGANMSFTADVAGEYTITWTFATNAISITFPELVWTDVRTGLTAGNYYTICYPKKMVYVRGGSLWSFNGKDGNFAYIQQESAPFEAGKPYLIYAESNKLEAVVDGDDAAAGSNNGLYGTLDYMDATALEAAGADYMLYQNALRPLGSNNHLAANRAYIKLAEISAPAPAPGRQVRKMPMEPQVATGIDALNVSDKPVKMVIDGQLFIIRGEKMYNANGIQVK